MVPSRGPAGDDGPVDPPPAEPRFRFDRSWQFEVPPDRLWALLSDTSAFREWWPWLVSLDPVPLEPGARARCSIRPPLPYNLDIVIDVDRVVAAELVEATISGDLGGPARLEVGEAPAGSTARLAWELEVRRPLLRVGTRLARPLLQWGHDWVVGNGVEQFRRKAMG